MGTGKQVVFELGASSYAVGIDRVERILPAQKLTPLPGQPADIKGVFDLRGRMVPTVDLRVRFGQGERDGGFFVVVSTPEGACAWRVDQVTGIEDCGELEACPPILAAQVHQAVAGVFRQGDQLVTVLDPDRCGAQFSAAEPEALLAAA